MPDWNWTDRFPWWAVLAAAVVTLLLVILMVVGAVRLLLKLVRLRHHLGELPTGGKVAFWASLAYTIFPIDLLPDPVYLDDMAVLGTALLYLTRLWRKRHGNVPIPQGRTKPPGPAPRVPIDRG